LPLLLFSFASAGRNDIAGAIGVIYVMPGVLVMWFAARRVTGRGAWLV
jgi:putative spermidine/putrescine transport system permease protein